MSLRDILENKASGRSRKGNMRLVPNLVTHSKPKLAICAAIEKKSFPVDPPIVVTKSIDQLDLPHEIRSLLKVFLSRNPHYKFLKTHRSSWSANMLQYILFDTRRKVSVAMNEKELAEKL